MIFYQRGSFAIVLWPFWIGIAWRRYSLRIGFTPLDWYAPIWPKAQWIPIQIITHEGDGPVYIQRGFFGRYIEFQFATPLDLALDSC